MVVENRTAPVVASTVVEDKVEGLAAGDKVVGLAVGDRVEEALVGGIAGEEVVAGHRPVWGRFVLVVFG